MNDMNSLDENLTENVIETITDIQSLPRHTPSNPNNYSKETLLRREFDIGLIQIAYPNADIFFIRLLWDLVEKHGDDKAMEMIKEWENKKPAKKED